MVDVTTMAWGLTVLTLCFGLRAPPKESYCARRLLVVAAEPDGDGCGDAGAARIVAALESVRRGCFEVVAVVPTRDAAKFTPELLRASKIWGIIITARARRALISEQIQAWRGYHLYDDAAFWESLLRRVDIDQSGTVGRRGGLRAPGRVEVARARSGDILLGVVMLVLAAPLMAVSALLIKLDSSGPVLYRQERVGFQGETFTLLKFRSMYVDAEARGPVWAAPRDPRVTRVGAFMRLTRIDELPQIWNILSGEMSFIGPRPERPHFVEQLSEVVPRYRERCLVKPGLTGWAQVNYPYGASVEDGRAKLSYDLYYIKHRNCILHAMILLSTIRVIIFQEGAR